ncbi:unnamed protein product [Kuraishia capsulata CBS 1993]|uniref:Peptide transporter PTR2 n=1 Tax=Kuraishia capsulata CBS 1993 TaxID=1382522 RepID=W6MQY2_9ASCO|nr:uncharacterized protein KUCA_T00003641001 [Kuraishia capsulata CBS 1993]CDK27662.1 unnamed protein product [Kuraishia capsulata CBS 1993]
MSSKSIELELLIEEGLDDGPGIINTDSSSTILEDDKRSLRRITGRVPRVAFLICLVELAERGSYYSLTGCLTNFIQRPLPVGGNGTGAPSAHSQQNAGALGLGLQWANVLYLMLIFLAYLTPIWGGFLSDSQLGKFKAVWTGTVICGVSHILFILAALPIVLQEHRITGLVLIIIAIVVLALGVGFIKPNLLPLLMDQYPHKNDFIMVLESGEVVIVDRKATLEKMSLIFYWSINVGCFFQFVTVLAEDRYGYWLAFSIPGMMYLLLPIVLIVVGPKLLILPPGGSMFADIVSVLKICYSTGWYRRFKDGTFWEYPSSRWDPQFVDDIKRTIDACKIFSFFVIFNVNDGSLGSIQTNQAGSLTRTTVPNDFFSVLNPLTILIMVPLQDYFLYPFCRKHNWNYTPQLKIFTGFILASIGSIIGAVLQYMVYQTSPCGYKASTCEIGTQVSPISAWWTSPVWILPAVGECFANVTAYELAYSRSPKRMQSLVFALFLASTSLSAVLGEICTIAAKDPYLVWPFAIFGIWGLVSATRFLRKFNNLHLE